MQYHWLSPVSVTAAFAGARRSIFVLLLCFKSIASLAAGSDEPSDAVSAEAATRPVQTLPRVEINGSLKREFGDLGMTAGSLGLRSVGTSDEVSAPSVRRIEDWLEQRGLAIIDAVGQLGLATSFSSRGFASNSQAGTGLGTSRLFIDRHPDIGRRFTRDLSTVDHVEFVSAQDATLFGAAAPGAALNYSLKEPSGRDASSISAMLGTNGALRAVLDVDRAYGETQGLRVIAASLDHDRTAEGIDNQNDNILAVYRAQLGETILRIHAEAQNNTSPFPFGTVYAGGKFWFDTQLVSATSSAERQYRRISVDLQTPFIVAGFPISLDLYAQRAHVERDETLFGFWTVTGPQSASGYFRRLTESYWQTDIGARLGSAWAWQGIKGRSELVWQRSRQTLDFAGPQSIAGFNLDLNSPTFTIDPNTLTLTPRTLKEGASEGGLGMAHRVAICQSVTLLLGARRSNVDAESGSNGAAVKTVADARKDTTSLGAGWQIDDAWRAFVSRSESFEPARGLRRDGSYVSPLLGKQWATGIEFQRSGFAMNLNGFSFDEVNFPGADPVDRNYVVNLGAIRSEGASVSITTLLGRVGDADFELDGTYTHQNARVVQRVNASQGLILPGAPSSYGSVRVTARRPLERFWLAFAGVGPRPGDAFATFVAPGFVRTDMGVSKSFTEDDQIDFAMVNVFDLRYVQALSAADNVWQGPRRRAAMTYTHRW